MTETLTQYLADKEFLKFIRAFKIYNWTKDLYDLHILKKLCPESLKEKLKLNPVTRNLLDLYYREFEESISTLKKTQSPKILLPIVESLVFLSQKHDRVINDFGKDSIEASQILNEYLDTRVSLRTHIEEGNEPQNNKDFEATINSYEGLMWSFFNKTKVIYLEHENEALIIWKDNERQSIFMGSELPTNKEIN
jgi:hypothetical protein|tara:strand:+ start:283 stop:864 length:582 start_codon:yes stop_codon:yes gene_type:complete